LVIKIRQIYSMTAAALLVILLALLTGCAGTGASSTAGTRVEQREKVPPPPPSETAGENEPAARVPDEPYDLESESPENDSVADSVKVEERIRPIAADTFSVEETVEPPAEAAGYELGYRVQLAAFTEPAGARELKKKVMATTGIAVYIDYEDGLYKVRAGDFATRADAYEARAGLTGDFPDAWIVRTTVMKKAR
jgi:cell division septation protein DedD